MVPGDVEASGQGGSGVLEHAESTAAASSAAPRRSAGREGRVSMRLRGKVVGIIVWRGSGLLGRC
jgi:hypothetical protein